jgi:hypothetical protein
LRASLSRSVWTDTVGDLPVVDDARHLGLDEVKTFSGAVLEDFGQPFVDPVHKCVEVAE